MIHWITPNLGTAARNDLSESEDVIVVDVRAMVDKAGNPAEVVRDLVDSAASALRRGRRVVVCCDYGMSRSNAIAAAAIAVVDGTAYDDALRRVLDATGERAIKLEVIAAVRQVIGQTATSTMPGKRALVTGGSGFLGRFLVTRLSSAHEVSAPGRQALDLTAGAAALDLFVRHHDVTDIVHLAQPRVFTSNEAMGPSLVMLRNVLDVCRENAIRLIFLSRWEVYSGYPNQNVLASEELPLFPHGAYGETKYLCECLLRQHELSYGLRIALVRLGTVYGPGGDKPRFIQTFIRQALAHQPIVTHRYTNGDPALDLVYIDDVCDLLSTVVSSGFTGDLNVGSGLTVSTPDIARQIVRILRSDSKISYSPVDAYFTTITMDNDKVKREFGWAPRTSIEAGLENVCKAETRK